MGALVSSRFHYIENNPSAQLSYTEVEHELQHLNQRERAGNLVAVGTMVVSFLALIGILGGGAFILGALLAIAAVSAAYSHCCRLAETGLRQKQMNWHIGHENQVDPALKPSAPRQELL